jgi:hypothetical protein
VIGDIILPFASNIGILPLSLSYLISGLAALGVFSSSVVKQGSR